MFRILLSTCHKACLSLHRCRAYLFVKVLLLYLQHVWSFRRHLVKLGEQLLALSIFLCVKGPDNLLYLVNRVKFQPQLVNWINQFFESIIKYLNGLFNLFRGHEVLEIILTVITLIWRFFTSPVFPQESSG